jgi:hypothetical protein
MSDNPPVGQDWQSGGVPSVSGGPPASAASAVPSAQPVDQLGMAYQRRNDTDYIANFWTAFGWGILTGGIFYLYMFYELIRRLKDHHTRRLDLLDAANAYAWQVANQRGLQNELRPQFERTSAGLENLRRVTPQFREPGTWLIILLVAGWLTLIGGVVVYYIVYCGLDRELVEHDRIEGGIEVELSAIFTRLGQPIPPPDPARVKRPDNYAARILVSIVTLGWYNLWWTYNIMKEPNQHFEINWAWEDALARSVQGLHQ